MTKYLVSDKDEIDRLWQVTREPDETNRVMVIVSANEMFVKNSAKDSHVKARIHLQYALNSPIILEYNGENWDLTEAVDEILDYVIELLSNRSSNILKIIDKLFIKRDILNKCGVNFQVNMIGESLVLTVYYFLYFDDDVEHGIWLNQVLVI